MKEEKKTPEDYADREINKKLGKSIARRKIQIKKLEVEIVKLKSGEMLPDEDSSSSDDNKEEKIVERYIERPRPLRDFEPFRGEPTEIPWEPRRPHWKNPIYRYDITKNTTDCTTTPRSGRLKRMQR